MEHVHQSPSSDWTGLARRPRLASPQPSATYEGKVAEDQMKFGRRDGVLLWFPGAIAGLFAFSTANESRLTAALGVAIAITIGGGLAAAISDSIAEALVGGREGTVPRGPTTKQMLSGILLVASTWILLQMGFARANRELIGCVDARAADLELAKPSVAVRSCLQDPDDFIDLED